VTSPVQRTSFPSDKPIPNHRLPRTFYYDGREPRPRPKPCRAEIDAAMSSLLGRCTNKPVGPHPHWSYQVGVRTQWCLPNSFPASPETGRGRTTSLHPERRRAGGPSRPCHVGWRKRWTSNLDALRVSTAFHATIVAQKEGFQPPQAGYNFRRDSIRALIRACSDSIWEN